MELGKVLPLDGGRADRLLELALVNTNFLIENPNDPPAEWRMDGRVIETSLVRSLALRGKSWHETKNRFTMLNSLPFNAINKFSATASTH
jgi:hypothetical protein